MKKRLVIVGANSFLGSNIINKIDLNEFQLIKLTSKDCNLEKETSINYLQNIVKNNDTIIFSAAKAPAKNWDMLGDNILMVNNFVKGLKNKKLKYLLNISSDAVYSDSENEIDESSETIPDNPHGLMHLFREMILNKNLKFDIGHIRPTLVYGTKDPHNGYGPNKFLRLAENSEDINLFGKGEELRDHVCVDDVANIAVTMIMNNIKGNINAVSAKPITFNEIAQKIKNSINNNVKIIYNPRSGPMPHNGYRVFKKSKITSFLHNFDAISLKDYIDGYKND